MLIPRSVLLILVAASLALGCGGSEVADPLGGGGDGSKGSMSATIDGVAWTGSIVESSGFTSGGLVVGGSDGKKLVSLGITLVKPGTISVGYRNANDGFAWVQNLFPAALWGSDKVGGAGSVTVTVLTSTHAVGTFSFDAVAAEGTGVVHVVNGKFDATF